MLSEHEGNHIFNVFSKLNNRVLLGLPGQNIVLGISKGVK